MASENTHRAERRTRLGRQGRRGRQRAGDPLDVADVRRILLVQEAVDDPVVLERVLREQVRRHGEAAEFPRGEAGVAVAVVESVSGGRPPSFAWPVFLGLAGSVVASRQAHRAGLRRWPYWAVGTVSTGFVGWVLLTVMPAALGRGEHARSIYGSVPTDDEPDTYVPHGIPGVTDVPGVHPDHHHHGPATAVDLEPPAYGSSVT